MGNGTLEMQRHALRQHSCAPVCSLVPWPGYGHLLIFALSVAFRAEVADAKFSQLDYATAGSSHDARARRPPATVRRRPHCLRLERSGRPRRPAGLARGPAHQSWAGSPVAPGDSPGAHAGPAAGRGFLARYSDERAGGRLGAGTAAGGGGLFQGQGLPGGCPRLAALAAGAGCGHCRASRMATGPPIPFTAPFRGCSGRPGRP